MIERVLHREHPAPRLADDRITVGDPEVTRQLIQLVLEELRRPEVRRSVRKMLALAAPDLVVQDTRPAEAVEVGDRLAVVVRRPRAAVTDDDRDGRI